jgi:hypothetical protein
MALFIIRRNYVMALLFMLLFVESCSKDYVSDNVYFLKVSGFTVYSYGSGSGSVNKYFISTTNVFSPLDHSSQSLPI